MIYKSDVKAIYYFFCGWGITEKCKFKAKVNLYVKQSMEDYGKKVKKATDKRTLTKWYCRVAAHIWCKEQYILYGIRAKKN